MDWNKHQADLMENIQKINEVSPDIVKGYGTLSMAGKKTNYLDAKTRELIALAVAVTTRCDGCISVHSKNALEAGAMKEEIIEALGVAVALNAGAALVYSSRVVDAIDNLQASN